jgi:tRNA pseudouridine32 synthase/23S rRNA pseudouridine746 synthase
MNECLNEQLYTLNSINKQELNIVFEDDHIIVVDKPSGVLCVPSQGGVPSLAQTVFDYCQSKGAAAAEGDTELVTKMDQMVVHRLGMDTSGLVVFAKTMDAVRGMNALFRTRKITRQYQALVAGHVQKDQGLINLPLMRCYEHPPYMRISTDEHQRALIDLDVTVVGSKLLEAPKTSLTHYSVVSRETYANNDDLPVTQLTLTSISGRTHQLNVHCAAVGHAIVGDTVYGWNGQAAANGGLETSTALDAASAELQEKIAAAAEGKSMCVHAKMVRFRHPITKEEVEFTSASPF